MGVVTLVKKIIHCFTAAPFPMIVCRKTALWACVRHVTDLEVVITQFSDSVKCQYSRELAAGHSEPSHQGGDDPL